MRFIVSTNLETLALIELCIISGKINENGYEGTDLKNNFIANSVLGIIERLVYWHFGIWSNHLRSCNNRKTR